MTESNDQGQHSCLSLTQLDNPGLVGRDYCVSQLGIPHLGTKLKQRDGGAKREMIKLISHRTPANISSSFVHSGAFIERFSLRRHV